MFHYIFSLFLFVAGAVSPQSAATQTDVTTTLSLAQKAYYEARFKDAIDMLLPLDTALQGNSERIKDRVAIKLQIALAQIGLNQTSEAKVRFTEVYQLDPQFALDPQQYAPKVLTLAQESKALYSENRCRLICEQTDRDLKNGKADALFKASGTPAACSCMLSLASKAVDIIYSEALEANRQGDLAKAIQKLRTVLKINPEHDLASEYLDLIENKIKVAADRILLEWRSEIEKKDFNQASAKYRELASLDAENRAKPALDQLRTEYRKTLTTMAQSWSTACKAGDTASMTTIRSQAGQLLPEPSMGQDILDQMRNCATPPAQNGRSTPVQTAAVTAPDRTPPARSQPATPPPSTAVPTTGAPATPSSTTATTTTAAPPDSSAAVRSSKPCIGMPYANAMARIKNKVNPELPPILRPPSPVSIRAKIRISEEGDVSIKSLEGGTAAINKALKGSLEQWKFYPALIDNEPRCAETELPIVVSR
jgi:tetratricopeptide (TPR) repeat protein